MMKITFDTQNKEEVAEVLAVIAPESKSEVATEPKEEKSIPKSTPKPKKTPEPKEEPVKKADKVSLADLKEAAKNAARTDKDAVKSAIGEFAPKLAEVDESNYDELYKKLQELGA